MSLPVTLGANLMCSFGMSPGTLVVTPSGPLNLIEGKPAATIFDFAPFVNITPFGLCSSIANPVTASLTAAALGVLTPGACTPVTTPWKPGSPTLLIGGKPALNVTSTCQCAYGGVITITNGGATKELIP